MIKQFFFVAAAAMLTTVAHAQEDTTYKPVELPVGFTSQLNVVYTKVGDWEGRMDVYLPKSDISFFHGIYLNKGVSIIFRLKLKNRRNGRFSKFCSYFQITPTSFKKSNDRFVDCGILLLVKFAMQATRYCHKMRFHSNRF